MNDIEFRRKVLLSVQRALLGHIYPAVRAVAIGYSGMEKLTLIYYLDRVPNEDDYEIISIVVTEIIADIEFKDQEEKCIFSTEPISKLDNLMNWVYVRKED